MDLMLDETVVSSGKLVSEIDRTGSTAPISTLSFDFIDLTDNYNFGNNTGIHLYVQPGQKLYPIENIQLSIDAATSRTRLTKPLPIVIPPLTSNLLFYSSQ